MALIVKSLMVTTNFEEIEYIAPNDSPYQNDYINDSSIKSTYNSWNEIGLATS